MATKQEVDKFLRDFKEKMKFWDVVFRDDRGKNFDTLSELELRPLDRKKILSNLKTSDYSEGPLKDSLNGGTDMWVFGKEVKSNEVYIKISFGCDGASVICISFHISEFKMHYPFSR
jgi:hypothetical protein